MQKCNQFTIFTVVTLFLFTSCYSQILFKIKPASNKVDTVIKYSGVDDIKVTEKEIAKYNITDDNLKRGIRIEMGRVPNDVFIRDPTPYHNLFQKYNWTEVHRRVQVKKVEIFDIVNRNVTLAIHSVVNNTTRRIKKLVGVRETVENTISSSWHNQGSPKDEIVYDINVTYSDKNFIYKNRRRFNHFESTTVPFGIPTIGYIYLDPGQIAYIELIATKSISLIKVDYVALLVGNVIANYAQVYGKYHFWAPSVGSIMKAAKLKNEFVTTEFIEVRSFFNPRVKIFDKYTADPINITKLIPFHPKKRKIN